MVSPNMVTSELLMTDSAIDGMAALDVSDGDAAHVKLAAEMVLRCSGLLAELEEFQSYLRTKKKENIVHIGSHLKNDLLRELEALKNVRQSSYASKRISGIYSCLGDQKSDKALRMANPSLSFSNRTCGASVIVSAA